MNASTIASTIEAKSPQPHQVARIIPRISPMAQPLKQWTVAMKASLLRDCPFPCMCHSIHPGGIAPSIARCPLDEAAQRGGRGPCEGAATALLRLLVAVDLCGTQLEERDQLVGGRERVGERAASVERQ